MRTHAVHSKGNQSKILVTPIESTVKTTLRFEIVIVHPHHDVKWYVETVMKVTPSLNCWQTGTAYRSSV
jgi:hypothetical protein